MAATSFATHYDPMRIYGHGPEQLRATRFRERVPLSPKFSADKRMRRSTSEYYIPWGEQVRGHILDQAITDFLGYSEPILEAGVVTGIRRIIPYPHPSFPNYLYAESVKNIEGDVAQGKDPQLIAKYDEAKVSLEFSSLPYKVLTDDEMAARGYTHEATLQRYVSITCKTTGRYEKVPTASGMKWFGTNVLFANSSSVILGEGDLSIIWHQIPIEAIPWTAINACMGCVDETAIGDVGGVYRFASDSYMGPILQTSAGRDRPKFLCLVPEFSDPYTMSNGEKAIDVNYRFKFYPYGANYFYRWDAGAFQKPVTAGGVPFFPLARLSTLFWGPGPP
jgi:hypothetical protein